MGKPQEKNLEAKCHQIVVVVGRVLRVVFRALGSVPKAQRATWGLDVQGYRGQEEREENLNKVSNRPVGSLHMSTCIAEPAL